jgi:spore maturation protein CgeB
MRIFQVFEFTANERLTDNRTWYRNLYEPLTDLGHDVVLVDAAEGGRALRRNDAAARAAFSQKLLDTFRKEHAKQPFELFFAYLMDGMVDVGAIDEIRKTGVPTCNFSCNNIHQFELVDELSTHFDFNLHAERDAAAKFAAIGATAIWWQMASNPQYFKPHPVPRTIPVSFVGANYALRARYVAHLLDHGIDVHTYGPRWTGGASNQWRSIAKHYQLALKVLLAVSPAAQYQASANLADHDFRRALSERFPKNLHGLISDEELILLYSRSSISLGFLEVYAHHDASQAVLQHLHLREFEAPMSGALYCTGYSDELAEFFEPDKEVLTYRNPHELLDKVRYYLSHPDQAEAVRQAGHRRALQDHTYHRRFQTLFAQLQLTTEAR